MGKMMVPYFISLAVENELGKKNGLRAGDFIGRYEVTEANVELIKAFLYLALKTKYLKPDTKELLIYRRGYRRSNKTEGTAKNTNTSRSRINYDMVKIRRLLGERGLEEVFGMNEEELKAKRDSIIKLIKRFREDRLTDGFFIDIPDVESTNESVDNDTWAELLLLMKLYSKKAKKFAEQVITKEQIGFINYLEANKDNLNEENKNRYEIVKKYLDSTTTINYIIEDLYR